MAELTAAKIFLTGNSYAVRIPKDLIDCKVLDPTRPIRVIFTQDRKGEDGENCTLSFLQAAIRYPLDSLDTRA